MLTGARALRLALLLGFLLLAGCLSLAPRYQRPPSPAPQAWPQGDAYTPTEAGRAADLAWRDFFTDPRLKSVIELALNNNRDLRVAILDIEEARAQFREQRASLLPTVTADGSATSERFPTGLGEFGPKRDVRIYTADVGVSAFELDLWGRVRNLTRQAQEQLLATEEARRAAQISLISEVAADYLTLAADRQRLKTAEDTLKADQETLRITEARFNDGIVSELDVRQAQTVVDQARSEVLTYTTQAAEDLNALDLVVGAATPDPLSPSGLDGTLPTLADVPAGLSSDVLLFRPDVLQAEHQLRGYNANIGAARAAFFPTITLTGSTGSESLDLDRLFQPGSGTWVFNPAISLPIFAGGKNVAALKLARAQRDVAVAQYELAIQTAFRETADALAQRGTAARQIEAQEQLVESASAALKLSQARYQKGVDTYLTLLDAQRTLYSAQQTLITARANRATTLVTLYRVLGGGVS
jgi:multidrug efflux system outer membrane protein